MTGIDDRRTRERSHETDRERHTANVVLLVGAILFIGAGVWLIDAMLAARKADECLSAGRRNCVPAERSLR